MKALLLFTFIFSINSYSRQFEVVKRVKSGKAKILNADLPDLISKTHFDGKYFKIVLDKTEEAVSFDNQELRLKAATTYYHLSIARNYFIKERHSKYVESLGKLIIRLEISNVFNKLGHFANDNKDPQFNNAVTVPPGDGYEPKGIKPWKHEIWFRPLKKIHRDDIIVHGSDATYKGLLKSYRNQSHMMTLSRVMVDVISPSSTLLGGDAGWGSLIRLFGSSIFLEMSYHLFDEINKVFARRWYSLDSALVPEIIYHEYSHVALSDHLYPSHSTAVIEGMADFFAGKIAKSPKLATKIKKYNTFNGKKAKNKKLYTLQFETENYANADFVFGMLWSLDDVLGKDKSENFVYDLRESLNTNNTIRDQFIEGILDTCRSHCETPWLDQMKILKFFHLKGI